MKKSPWVLSVLVATTGLVLAHPPDARHGGPPIDEIATELGLDDTQKSELQRIFDEQRAKMKEERAQLESAGQRPSREEMRAKHEEKRAEMHQQLSTVLTAEQLAKFEKLMQERRSRHHERETEGRL